MVRRHVTDGNTPASAVTRWSPTHATSAPVVVSMASLVAAASSSASSAPCCTASARMSVSAGKSHPLISGRSRGSNPAGTHNLVATRRAGAGRIRRYTSHGPTRSTAWHSRRGNHSPTCGKQARTMNSSSAAETPRETKPDTDRTNRSICNPSPDTTPSTSRNESITLWSGGAGSRGTLGTGTNPAAPRR